MHWTVLPLADGVLRPTDAEDALVVHDATGSGSVDWVQWWPMVSPRARDQQGSQGWLYPSGYMKMVRVCFPVKLDAGVALASRTAPTPTRYPHYIEKWVDIEVAPGTVSPQFWLPNGDLLQQIGVTGGVRAILEDGNGNTDLMRFSLSEAVEVYPSWHGNPLNANVRFFRVKSRMSVPDPVTGIALCQEAMFAIQREIGGNGRAMHFWHNWITSDSRKPDHVHALPNKVKVTFSIFPDPYFWYEDARLPESTPTVYNAAGNAIVTPGSGSSRVQSFTGPENENRYTEYTLWDPSDRVEVAGIEPSYRDKMIEGACQVNSGVMLFPFHNTNSANPDVTQEDLDTFEAEKLAKIQGIAEDWQHGRPGEKVFGNHGYVPPYTIRSSFSSLDEAHAAACDQADDEFEYHRTQGQNVTWPVRDPLHRAIMGPRPRTRSGGDSAGFGHVKNWKEAASTCGDLRAMEVTSHQMFANFTLSLREEDGEIFDPLLHTDQDTRDVLKEQCVPFYQGYPGYAAQGNFPVATVDGKTVSPSSWGKPFSGSAPSEGGRAIRLGGDGDRGNNWHADEQIQGGFDAAHQDVNVLATYVQLSGDPYLLYLLDGVAVQPLCNQLTPKTDEAFSYFRDSFYLDEPSNKGVPEAWASSGPFCTNIRDHARQLQTAHYCYRMTGDPRLKDHIAKNPLKSIAPFAVGSSRRGIRWWDASRLKNPSWPHRHEFHPATDVGSCWAWCAIPETHQSDTDDITFGSAGGDRKWISYIRNREGTAGRDFTNPGPLLGATSTHPPIFWGDSKFDLSTMSGLDTASTYSHEYLKPIGVEEHPDGTESYGCTLYQSESMNATGGFYLVGLFIFTRTAGVRELWGTDGNNCVRLDQSNGDVYLVVNGDSQKVATLSITRGIPTIIEIRRGDSGFVVVEITDEARSADSSGSLGVTLGGTFDCSGFGWDGDTTSYFDDFVLEFGMFVPQTSESLRKKTREYLRTKWDAYSTPEFALTEESGHWENVPMVYAKDASLGDDAVMLQPGNSIFEISMLGVAMWGIYQLLRSEAMANPGSEVADCVDFAEEWFTKTARWVAYHGMSSNSGFIIGGQTDANWTVFKCGAFDRFLTDEEMTLVNFQAEPYPVNGNSKDESYPEPNNYRWYAADTWGFCAQYMVPIWLATQHLTGEPDTFAKAAGVLERNVPAVLGTNPGGLYGWGDIGYDKSQHDPWMMIAPDLAGPFTPGETRVTFNHQGQNAIAASPTVDRPVAFSHAGVNTLAAVPTIVPQQVDINVRFDHVGVNNIALQPRRVMRAAFAHAGTNLMSATPRKVNRGTFAHVGVNALSVAPVVSGGTTHACQFSHAGVNALGASPTIDHKALFEHVGVNAMALSERITQDHSVTFAHAGTNAMAVTATVQAPSTIFQTFAHVGRNTLSASASVVAPIQCEFSHVGVNSLNAEPILGVIPAPPPWLQFQRELFRAMANRRGIEITYYGNGGASPGQRFKVLVDIDGKAFDGQVLTTVEGVTLHIPRHQMARLEVAENDRVDVPFCAGGSTQRARIVNIVHEDLVKFVVEVEN